MYFNRASREVFITFSGIVGTCEKLIDILPSPRWMSKGMIRNIKMVRAYAEKVVKSFEEQLDKDQWEAALRNGLDTEFVLVSKANPRTRKEYYTVPAEVLKSLAEHCLLDCATCLKDSREIKRCQLRRDLLQAGMLPGGTGECPFRVG